MISKNLKGLNIYSNNISNNHSNREREKRKRGNTRITYRTNQKRKLNCSFTPTPAYGSSSEFSQGSPGGLGSVLVSSEHGGGRASWIAETLVAPSAWGSRAPDSGDLELLESFSRLWPLAFKGSPFLILSIAQRIRHSKGHPL